MLRAFDRLIDGLALVAGLLLCALVVLICADVGARYFHLFSMPWSLDVAQYALYAITFMGSPWVLREQGHISIDIFVQLLNERHRRRVERVAHIVGAATCALLCYYSVRVWWQSLNSGTQVHQTFVFPEWWLMTLAPPIFLVLFLIFLRWIVEGPKPQAPHPVSDGM